MPDLTTLLSKFLNGLMSMPSASKGAMVALVTQTTKTQTAANTNETDLATLTAPANALSENGQALRLLAWGDFAANGNTKTVRVRTTGAALYTVVSGAVNDSQWWVEVILQRRAASQQSFRGRGGFAASNGTFSDVDVTENEAADIVFRVTGQNGTGNAGDIVLTGARLDWLPAGATHV